MSPIPEEDRSTVRKLVLTGSTKLVTEFFQYGVQTILFQRGVYPAEDFSAVKKYGLKMMTSTDDQVKAYIRKIMSQLRKWMHSSSISKLVIVITSKTTGEHVERWQFDVNMFNDPKSKQKSFSTGDQGHSHPQRSEKSKRSESDIQQDIQALFRQITASVTFLPVLDKDCTFNVLVYADADSDVPLEWEDSDAKEVKNAEKVQLRSFSTNSHRIDTIVSYRLGA